MTLAYWCILLAALMPLAFAGIAKLGHPGFTNRRPRDFLDELDGYRRRAHWTQLNSYEAFPPFAAAVIIAHATGGNQMWIDALALAFIVVRVSYGWLYLADRPTARSLAWLLGLACTVGLFIVAAAGA